MRGYLFRQGKKGSIALLAAFSLILLLGFFALVFNVGLMQYKTLQGRNAAESAALAAVKELDFTPAGLTDARNVAAAMIRANDPSNELKFDSQSEVLFGVWDEASSTFTASREPLAINAVKVVSARTNQKQNSLSVLLAGFLGSSTMESRASSIAFTYAGTPAGEAPIFPVAVSSCVVRDLQNTTIKETLACDREIVLGDADRSLCKSNPGDCAVDRDSRHLRWTLGNTNTSIGTSELRTQTNDLTSCLRDNDSAACARANRRVAANIVTESAGKWGTFNANNSSFSAFLAQRKREGKGITVQVPVYSEANCTTFVQETRCECRSACGSNKGSNKGSKKGGGSSCSCPTGHGSDRKGSQRQKAINGFASIEIKSIRSTGDQKYLRGVVKCDVVVNKKSTRSLGVPEGNNSRRKGYGTQTAPKAKPACQK
jgi:Flp pilus assembly protein TadG